jgi:molybdopterin-guanine dinucleotide biosynthesis protein B
VKILSEKEYRIGTVKHTGSLDIEIDKEGKDTFRHYRAGAKTVVLATPDKMALFKYLVPPNLDSIVVEFFKDEDLILVEGYKSERKPKIETTLDGELICDPKDLLGVVGNYKKDLSLPCFTFENLYEVADFVEDRFLKKEKPLIELFVNGENIPMKSFVQRVFANTLLGLISSLRGVEDPKDILIRFKKKQKGGFYEA